MSMNDEQPGRTPRVSNEARAGRVGELRRDAADEGFTDGGQDLAYDLADELARELEREEGGVQAPARRGATRQIGSRVGNDTEGDPMIGATLLGRYRVTSCIGEGGMGTVYLAEHTRIHKRFAVKILAQRHAHHEQLVQRFVQEAQATSMIAHENIVEILDVGETKSGAVFYVMEYLAGEDLGQLLHRCGRLTWARARGIIIQICKALEAAHRVGVIHRDMKPGNCFRVTRGEQRDVIKVLDFGIAKVRGGTNLNQVVSSGSGVGQTHSGMIFGTAEYMSPEQAQGVAPDHRVDIYATGIILYQMLTGTLPFKAESYVGVLTKQLSETPLPPREACPQAKIPEAVEAVILRAMHKDRKLRFSSMTEMIAQLQAIPEVTAAHTSSFRPPAGSPETRSAIAPPPQSLATPVPGVDVHVPPLASLPEDQADAGTPAVEPQPPADEHDKLDIPQMRPEVRVQAAAAVEAIPSAEPVPATQASAPLEPAKKIAAGDAPATDSNEPSSVPLPELRRMTAASPAAGRVRETKARPTGKRELSTAAKVVGGGLLLAVPGVAAVLLCVPRPADDGPSAQVDPTPKSAGLVAEQSSRTAAPAAAVAPVTLQIETNVPAQIFDVHSGKVLGQSGATGGVNLPRGHASLELELRAPGYKTQKLFIVPSRNLKLRRDLVRELTPEELARAAAARDPGARPAREVEPAAGEAERDAGPVAGDARGAKEPTKPEGKAEESTAKDSEATAAAAKARRERAERLASERRAQRIRQLRKERAAKARAKQASQTKKSASPRAAPSTRAKLAGGSKPAEATVLKPATVTQDLKNPFDDER